MYNIKIIKKALDLLQQYDYSFIKVSRELNIPIDLIKYFWER